MSQGIMSSADTTAQGFEEISAIEGDLMRTDIATIRGAELSWAGKMRLTLENSGQTKLADYSKWDVFAQYYDATGEYHALRLPYTSGMPGENEWQAAAFCLNGAPEAYEPGLLNPGEEMIVLARLSPAPAYDSSVDITVATSNGAQYPFSFTNYSYTLLHPHTEDMLINSNKFYELAEAAPSDGSAVTFATEFESSERGRKPLVNLADSSRTSRHLFPLKGIREIPAAAWTVYYRAKAWGDPLFPRNDDDANFDIDIQIRTADGGIRTVLATNVASAYFPKASEGEWITISAGYDFPGYAVVDDSDYLEISYYGEADLDPTANPGYLQLMIDDDSLDASLQTRIES